MKTPNPKAANQIPKRHASLPAGFVQVTVGLIKTGDVIVYEKTDPPTIEDCVHLVGKPVASVGQSKIYRDGTKKHAAGVFEIMADFRPYEIQHWLDTTPVSSALALFEAGAKLERDLRAALAHCEKENEA